jgi:hypothetical protein
VHPLALFDVHGLSSRTSGFEQIGLAAQKCGDLQDVYNFCDLRTLVWQMNIGQSAKTGFLAHALERAQSGFESRTASGSTIGTIRFVEACLEDHAPGDFSSQPSHRLSDAKVQCI